MKFYAFAVLLLFTIACKKDSIVEPVPNEPTLNAPTLLDVRDVDNTASGADLELSFSRPSDLSLIEEFRVFIVKSASSGSFDSLAAVQATDDQYLAIPFNGNTRQIPFSDGQTDISGDLLEEGIDYDVFVMSKGSADSGSGGALSSAATIRLRQRNAVRTLTGFIQSGSGGMDADAEGNVYMGDFGVTLNGGGTNVFRIDPEGNVSVFANGMNGASGNDFDNEGNLYQANITNGTINKVTPEGQVSLFASNLQGPVGVVFDGTDSFFVCNCGGNTISKIDMDGNVSSFSTSGLYSCPNGIDIDEDGNLYVVNFNNATIVKITPDGTASSFATLPGTNNAHIIVRDDIMYVAARSLNQLYTLDFQGNLKLFAGTGQRGLDNGDLDQATFSLPNDFALSPDGKKLYLNDKDPAATGNTISPVVIRVISLVN